jgi:signal transduction histidine kinase
LRFATEELLPTEITSKQGAGVGLSIVKETLDGIGAGIIVERCRGGGLSYYLFYRQ